MIVLTNIITLIFHNAINCNPYCNFFSSIKAWIFQGRSQFSRYEFLQRLCCIVSAPFWRRSVNAPLAQIGRHYRLQRFNLYRLLQSTLQFQWIEWKMYLSVFEKSDRDFRYLILRERKKQEIEKILNITVKTMKSGSKFVRSWKNHFVEIMRNNFALPVLNGWRFNPNKHQPDVH